MVIITGIGRSGTSFTARVLHESGAVFKGAWFDEKAKAGMEYGKVSNVNKMILTGEARSVRDAVSHLGFDDLESELGEGVIVKDPSFVITLKEWIESSLNIEHIVYCKRDLREVYDSSMTSGHGMGGDWEIGIMIPSYAGFRIFFAYVEKIFFDLAKRANIPVTVVNFPDSVHDFSEVEKLSFLSGVERLREAWEKNRDPRMVRTSGKGAEISQAAQDVRLEAEERENKHIAEAYRYWASKFDKMAENNNRTIAKYESKLIYIPWLKRLEQAFRMKVRNPVKDFMAGDGNSKADRKRRKLDY